ncbi:MAG: hypothetical protein HY343_09395 [Lentisphaerae bacterium]|nr:hypothetical protein [Lentisphaerota bacterium]
MTTPSEHKTVQGRILKYAQEIGWTYVPAGALRRGENRVALRNPAPKRLVWLELAVSDRAGQWPSSPVDVTSLYPGWGRW